MAEIKEFVINDRRKFTSDGDIRPDAPPSEPKPIRPETLLEPEVESSARLVENKVQDTSIPHELHRETAASSDLAAGAAASEHPEDQLPPPPTADQLDQAKRAYTATVDRLDTAIRSTNPGMDPIPQMSFDRVIQSLYMQALLQLGGATEPGQQPQLDLLGARQTIDMLDILAGKTSGNLSEGESNLVDSALFELRMGFLEVTQALARQAAARQPQPGAPGTPGAPTSFGPKIVR
jgi:hypothetical protein